MNIPMSFRSKWIEVFDRNKNNIDSINVDRDFDETDIRGIQRLLDSYDWPKQQPAYVKFSNRDGDLIRL